MKVLILAGGYGSRLAEETHNKPKPMIEIGDKPILWHIMKTYSHYGFNEFIILLGYKGQMIKEYFTNYSIYNSEITVNLSEGTTEIHKKSKEPWIITLLDTGINTMTGGRIKKAKQFIKNDTFMLTYGDGVCDLNINNLVKYHYTNKSTVTLTAVQPKGRFGTLDIQSNLVSSFIEKPLSDGTWINGGFMVCEPETIDLIDTDESVFEEYPLQNLAKNKLLGAYRHYGFWQCMDTLRDKSLLEKLWNEGNAPWKVW